MNEDPDLTTRLVCDVEVEVAGPSEAVVNKWVADTLRKLADRFEKGEVEDGFHSVTDNVGKEVGTVYVDYSEGD